MLYDTVLLRTFAAICDAGSFTKAAREVNLTQSAVSLHVKRLEDQVGSRLIMRNTRGVRLTEHGEILLSYARRILALYKEAEHRLSRDSGGLVRIGAAEYFDLHTLSALLGQFSARYPAVRLQIELGIGPDISALLDEGELDLVIETGNRLAETISSRVDEVNTTLKTTGDSLVLDLIETALSSGEGARLKRALVYEQELCVDARVYFGWRVDPGLFEISLKLAPGVEAARAESALWVELGRICERQVPDRELDRAKNMVRAQLLRALATTNGRAHTIGQMEVMLGGWRAMLDLPDRYAAITAADIQRVAQRTFAPHRRNVVTLIPGEVEE